VKEDDFWLCWIVERLDSETKKKEYLEIKKTLEKQNIFFKE
jgi:hypothetical protein